MKNYIYLLFGLIILVGCETTPCECEEKSNGFVERSGQTIMLGSDSSVDVVKQIDNAWKSRDYETLKSLVADDAKLYHDDGRVSTGGDEFVAAIESDYTEMVAEGKEWDWVMNFAFAVKVSESDDPEEFNDDGEWVSARFTTASDEIYEEWYYIVDGKLSWWGSAKRGLYTE